MKKETICIHEGYETDPTTKACAVPIYQTVAYEFNNAQHALLRSKVALQRWSFQQAVLPLTTLF